MGTAEEIFSIAKKASIAKARATTGQKNEALYSMTKRRREKKADILDPNRQDIKAAEEQGLSKALQQRLVFDERKISARIRALEEIASLPDPLGDCGEPRGLPNGLTLSKRRVPIGVVALIYEARPHVTVNAGALGLKSGNAVILKGGSETIRSNICLGRLWQQSLADVGLPHEAIQVVQITQHQAVNELLKLDGYIDLVIPRGGKSLIDTVVENSRIPVIKHYLGICHTYVDGGTDLEMALQVCLNAKLCQPEVCNAMETLLVAEKIAPDFLPEITRELEKHGVEIRGCARTRDIVPQVKTASEDDWKTEYLDLILSIKVVEDVEEAISHINFYGSHHTDAIISNDRQRCRRFVEEVDSGVVLVNASTMFNDASQLGMGAEIGISTDKIHARGPMGLEELRTYKLVIQGNGEVMER
ncbi:MAG TPA: glutamate-5-semialdehyde dehydrogenase [Candidatus Latescibacteria bacterium]|nr:glutamate-5-semialdehyde dehydrogenase [Candidatus Latescibacterota bacterium]